MSRAAQLAIELTEKGAPAVAADIDKVTSSAKRMGDTTETAGKQAGRGLDATASGADEVASKGSQAAGAVAGLGGLVGGSFGAAMETGGTALQGFADAGDLVNAALENSVVATARAKAGTLAKAVADKASAAATKGLTVAQKALNLAQRASPIGLIITGLILLAGLLVLAYKRSATFRSVVQQAMKVARAGVDLVVKGFKALGPVVATVMKVVATVVKTYVAVYVGAFKLGLKAAQLAWNGVKAVVTSVVGFITRGVTGMKTTLGKVWSGIRSAGAAAFRALIAPVQKVVDLVQSLLDKISSIHIPGSGLLSKIGVGGGGGGGSSLLAGPTTRLAPATTVNSFTINLTGTASPADAEAFMTTIDRTLRSQGKAAVFS